MKCCKACPSPLFSVRSMLAKFLSVSMVNWGTQIVVGVLAGVARTGRKTAAKAPPELGEVVTQMGDRFSRQSPALGDIQR